MSAQGDVIREALTRPDVDGHDMQDALAALDELEEVLGAASALVAQYSPTGEYERILYALEALFAHLEQGSPAKPEPYPPYDD